MYIRRRNEEFFFLRIKDRSMFLSLSTIRHTTCDRKETLLLNTKYNSQIRENNYLGSIRSPLILIFLIQPIKPKLADLRPLPITILSCSWKSRPENTGNLFYRKCKLYMRSMKSSFSSNNKNKNNAFNSHLRKSSRFLKRYSILFLSVYFIGAKQ